MLYHILQHDWLDIVHALMCMIDCSAKKRAKAGILYDRDRRDSLKKGRRAPAHPINATDTHLPKRDQIMAQAP